MLSVPNSKLPRPHPLLQNLHPLGQGSHVCSTHPLGIRWNQNLFKIIPRTFQKDSSINTKTLQTPLLILSVQALAPGRQLPWQQTWTDKDECCAQCRTFSPICLKNVAPAWPFIRAGHVDSSRYSSTNAERMYHNMSELYHLSLKVSRCPKVASYLQLFTLLSSGYDLKLVWYHFCAFPASAFHSVLSEILLKSRCLSSRLSKTRLTSSGTRLVIIVLCQLVNVSSASIPLPRLAGQVPEEAWGQDRLLRPQEARCPGQE